MRVTHNQQKYAAVNITSLLGCEGECNITDKKSLHEQFASLVGDITRNGRLLHGIRIECMFGFVAAALRQCDLIKHEDMGIVYASDEIDVQIPDYYILLKNKQELFVEVKNCHKIHSFNLKDGYIKKLLAYPKVSKANLKIAIYWSRWQLWTLVALDAFSPKSGKYTIRLGEAMKQNEMAIFGDAYLATVSKLRFVIRMDISKGTAIPAGGGACEFLIKAEEMYAGDKIISNPKDKSLFMDLIFFGMDNGTWNESKSVNVENRKIESITYEYIPAEDSGANFSFLAPLSTIIARKYNQITAPSGKIKALLANYNDTLLDKYFPLHPREQLPLWIFHQTLSKPTL
jgi:hypothetical protein